MDMSITSLSGGGMVAATPLPSNFSMKDEKPGDVVMTDNIDLNKSELSDIMSTPNKAKCSSSPNIKPKTEIKTAPKKYRQNKAKKCKHKMSSDCAIKKASEKYSFVLQSILFEYLESKADTYGKSFSKFDLNCQEMSV
jgi:hypothetical protein